MSTRRVVAMMLSGVLSVTVLPMLASAPATAAVGTISKQGSTLYLGGAPYRFTGVNAYELATYWGVNGGCGPMATDAELDSFFAGLRPDSLVRVWAWQGLATNWTTKQRDWRGIDRVVNAAARHNQRLIMVLAGQGADGCDDGHWKDVSWYNGGYRQAFNDNGLGIAPAPYWNYIHEVAARYAASPAVGFWELVSEPEPMPSVTGPCDHASATAALRSFFDTVGTEMHRIDPNHLIGSGTIGSGQCGTAGTDYQYVHSSAGVDLGSYHDYGADNVPLPGDQWNGMQVRINQLKAIAKPFYVGEVGMKAQNAMAGCMTLNDRRVKMQAKMDAQFTAGINGFVPWNWFPSNDGSCNYETVSFNDPLLTLLHDYPLGNATTTTTTVAPTTTTTVPPTTTTTAPPTTTTTVPTAWSKRINAGGGSYTDNNGQTWASDSGYLKGKTATQTVTVANTSAPGIYVTERYRMSGYRIPVPAPGTYTVRLYMAETTWSLPGLRVFTITAEGSPIAINLDIFASVGKNNQKVVQATVTTADSNIDIGFKSIVGDAKVNGIELIRS